MGYKRWIRSLRIRLIIGLAAMAVALISAAARLETVYDVMGWVCWVACCTAYLSLFEPIVQTIEDIDVEEREEEETR